MILFTQNTTFGQLYAEDLENGEDYRIPTNSVKAFLAAVRFDLDELLASPQWAGPLMVKALEKYNG